MTTEKKYPLIAKLAEHIGKPISILDTETTGLGSPENVGIVDFAVITVHPDGREVAFETLINSTIPLTEGASKIHGIYPKDIVDAPPFEAIAAQIKVIFTDRVISGFNSLSYDTPIIRARVDECLGKGSCPVGQHLDIRSVFTKGNKYGKGKLVEVAEQYGVKIENAHRAMGDVIMTIGVFEALLERHGQDHVLAYLTGVKASPSAAPQKQSKNDVVLATINGMAKPLARTDYDALSASLSMSVKDLSFTISELIANDQIVLSRVRDAQENARIVSVLPDILADEQEKAGEDAKVKLTPVLKQLTENYGIETDFVQLRVAMKDLEALREAEQEESQASLAPVMG